MQTYRRFASTASSTSRSASTSMHHGHSHGHGHPHGISRSSSTTGAATNDGSTTATTASRGLSIVLPSTTTTPAGIARGIASPSGGSSAWSPSSPYGTLSSSNLNLSPEPYNRDTHGQTDLHTIAESLLAHVTFGPYHIASSPVPSSHMHTLLAASQSSRNRDGRGGERDSARGVGGGGGGGGMERNKENLNASSNSLSSSTTSLYSTSYTPSSVLGPSARRQFEGKEGSHNRHHHNLPTGQHRLATVNYPPLQTLQISTTNHPASSSSTSTPVSTATLSQLSISPSHTPRSNHPRARFTIGPGPQEERGRGGRGRYQEEGTRGRGLGRKSVGVSVRERERERSSGELWELDEDEERGRDCARGARGRRGDVKVLQQ